MIVIGWREWVALPALGIPALRAKVDTGARTSALHVDAQWRFTEAGAPWVGFKLTAGEPGAPVVDCAAPLLEEREVTDSGGHRTRRAFLRTRLRLAGVERDVEVNLAARHGMRFPMLLGRTAIAAFAFTVDPAGSFLVSGDAPVEGHE